MSLRLVQAGQGDPRDVVVIYHLTGEGGIDGRVRAAAPRALIVNDTRAPHTYDLVDRLDTTVAQALKLGGAKGVGHVVLAGFSEGVMVTRSVLDKGGPLPDALVLADGTHGQLPILPSQWTAWTSFASAAKRREKAFVASATSIQTETGPQPYITAAHGLERITGWNLQKAGPNASPVRTSEGYCVVYRYAGNDAPAHVYQAMYAFPKMLGEAMRLMSGGASGGSAGPVLLGVAALLGVAIARGRR